MGSEGLYSNYPESFVHLHLHTQYSLLDGAIRIHDLVKKAQEFEMKAVAQTDHGNMFGAIDFYSQMKKVGIKPLLGSEIYFTPGSRLTRIPPKKKMVLVGQDEQEGRHHIHHLILLAKNLKGYQNLCKLLSRAYLEGFYYKPRADLDLLKEYSEGLIATTACLKGEVGYNFFMGQDEKSHQAISKLVEVFKDDFYLEIQENGIPEQQIVNKKVIEFAKEKSIGIVATNDCHYINREDASAHEVLLSVQTGKTFQDEGRMKLTSSEFYFKSPQEMRSLFHYIPEACDNTLRIADKCNLDFKWVDSKGRQIYHLPNFELPNQVTEEDYFKEKAREGLLERFDGPYFVKKKKESDWDLQKKLYEERLDEELQMIIQMGFQGYFLVVADFIGWAKQRDILVGPGRGSGAGSLVAYSLKITNIDPLQYNLLFERFINPERISMPDFDVDFCQERRDEVIQYVTQKYGQDRVAQIITFGTLQAKGVIRDVSRVFGLPYVQADMLAKLVPEELGITLEKAIQLEPKFKELEEKDTKIQQILKISRRLEGLLRHASIHAAGVIITNKPLVEYCPLFRGKEGEQVVQFDKDFSEKIGLVKFDFLGLKTLTVLDLASGLIRRNFKSDFDLESIDFEDPKVYSFISQGKTMGVFQLESAGMKDLCKRIAPDSLEDITAINALFRPGPLGSGMVDDFVEIKHGRKAISYPFKELEPILKDTYGIIVYQEQVMNIARVVAGYTLGQADILRKAMGKKQVEIMDEHRKIFAEGAQNRKFDIKKAVELFDLMAKFAEYGFNKSHAVAYAFIAYQTAYLKYYYPAEFFAALLSTELSNMDKITSYIKDAKELGLSILPPDINESLWMFNVVQERIRFGLGAIKNVGEAAVNSLVEERSANGPFLGFIDFCERCNFKAVNKRVIESMIKVGVFDSCEKMNRKTLLENLEMVMTYAQNYQKEKLAGQQSLFAMGTETENLKKYLNIQEMEDFSESDKLNLEFELMGVYVSGHPLGRFESVLAQLSTMNIFEVQEIPATDRRNITLCGLISARKNLMTKKGDKMAFLQLEDLHGKIECIVFPKTYQEFESFFDSQEPVLVEGTVRFDESPRKFFPSKFSKLASKVEETVAKVHIYFNLNEMRPQTLAKVKDILGQFRGATPVNLIFEDSHAYGKMPLSEDFWVDARPQLIQAINHMFEKVRVQFLMDSKNP